MASEFSLLAMKTLIAAIDEARAGAIMVDTAMTLKSLGMDPEFIETTVELVAQEREEESV